MSALDPNVADKLAKLCGLFGSDHDGERASAAAMAEKLIRSYGLTWPQVISSSASRFGSTPGIGGLTIEEQIDFVLREGDGVLNAWEEGFLRGIRGRQFLTGKQLSKLSAIVSKAQAYAEALA